MPTSTYSEWVAADVALLLYKNQGLYIYSVFCLPPIQIISSDTTKERFLATYQFRDTVRAQDQFNSTVLEFVRIFQSALSLFEFFPVEYEEVNGLLCDVTVDGIRQWLIEIGEPYLKIEVRGKVTRSFS